MPRSWDAAYRQPACDHVTRSLPRRPAQIVARLRSLLCLQRLCFALACASVSLLTHCSPRSDESTDPVPNSEAPDVDSADPLHGDGAGGSAGDHATPQIPDIHKASLREHPATRAWVFEPGREPYALPPAQAEARGHTLIDLSDGWVPYIFSSKTPGRPEVRVNRYAERFVDLANDRSDADGHPLPSYRHNYLELYGIPPTLSVLAREFTRVSGSDELCLEEAGYDPSVFLDHPREFAYRKRGGRRRLARHRSTSKKLRKQMRKANIAADDFEAAAQHPKTRNLYQKWRRLDEEIAIIKQAQIRFECERLYPTNKGRGRAEPGNFDRQVHLALAAFEKKHDIRGWGHFTKQNLTTLGQTATESTHARLLRTLRARVVSGAGVVEDGSARRKFPDFAWTDSDGASHELRDVAGEMQAALVEGLDLADPQSAAARLDALSQLEDGFGRLLVATRLPAKPAYHGEDASEMEFKAVIDRGDVWYDFIFDDEGNRIPQPRRRFPHLTLYTVFNDQEIPLVHWRTTIGSWRIEKADEHLWLAYKNSDVGKRVWKDIVAAPTWIPPKTTPAKALIKYENQDGERVPIVSYDHTGPGYFSAYGLVAAYHIRQIKDESGEVVQELDNQIRTHGSSDYMSILRRYSHGCHRLYNMNAVEMFSFILQHRSYARDGQIRLGFRREFEYEDQTFSMQLDSRGYRFTLTEPIPVEVLEGRIRGQRKRPHKALFEKPGENYEGEGDETGESGELLEDEGLDIGGSLDVDFDTNEDGTDALPIVPFPSPTDVRSDLQPRQ